MGFATFRRCLLRSEEIASELGMRATVVRVYLDTLKLQAQAFLDADTALTKQKALVKEKNAEAWSALADLDAPYREARSVVWAYLPHAVLPDTLLKQPTDTDKVAAVETLLALLEEHSGEAWAAELAQGEIGQMALATIAKVNAAIAAGAALAAARIARSTAFEAAYQRYLRFKRLVRDALGPKSRQYRRLHQRKGAAEEKPAERERQPEPIASPPASAAPAAPVPARIAPIEPDAPPASDASAAPAVPVPPAASTGAGHRLAAAAVSPMARRRGRPGSRYPCPSKLALPPIPPCARGDRIRDTKKPRGEGGREAASWGGRLAASWPRRHPAQAPARRMRQEGLVLLGAPTRSA